MLHYLKFFHYYFTIMLGLVCLLLAGNFIILGFVLFVAAYVGGDALLGDDLSQPELKKVHLLNSMLYSALPLGILLLCVNAWLLNPHTFAFEHSISQVLHYDFVAAKENTNIWQKLCAAVFSAFLLSALATVVGHELVHRLNRKKDLIIGRWLMSLSLDANFSIEHVFNHHAKVATLDDPASAPRGRDVYTHVFIAIFKTNRAAWLIEKKRLARNKQSLFSFHNRCLRGYAMSLSLLFCISAVFSAQSALFVFLIACLSKVILEIVNYMEHYGLVRDPKQIVQPRHSWNSNRKVSCWTMFNLPRHSHHHAKANLSFEKLQAMPEAPTMISGYISTIGIALVPPLWFALMSKKLEHWDQNHANQRELEILAEQQERRDAKRKDIVDAFGNLVFNCYAKCKRLLR